MRINASDINKNYVIVALMIGFSLIVYAVLNNTYKERILKQKSELVENCFLNAESAYQEGWKNNCRKQGLEDNCSLPKYMADDLNKDFKENKDNCFKVFAN